ncbi:MAG: tetratricopeptide repeat protein [Planctomycetota bacterium]|jgi:tetratricopeptide (TPR) repeat protein
MTKEISKEVQLADSPAEGEDDSLNIDSSVSQGSITASLGFAVHAIFYYAGKAADKIVSLYSGAFKLDKAYVADFNKTSGIACVRQGNLTKAIPLLEKALKDKPGDTDIRMQLVEAYSLTSQNEKAKQHLAKILEANPDSARAVRALGILYMHQQDYDRAIEHLERAVELDPDHARTYYRLGAAYDNSKMYDQAVKSFRKTISLDPRFAKAYQALGFTYESMGNRESAVECFKKALEID